MFDNLFLLIVLPIVLGVAANIATPKIVSLLGKLSSNYRIYQQNKVDNRIKYVSLCVEDKDFALLYVVRLLLDVIANVFILSFFIYLFGIKIMNSSVFDEFSTKPIIEFAVSVIIVVVQSFFWFRIIYKFGFVVGFLRAAIDNYVEESTREPLK